MSTTEPTKQFQVLPRLVVCGDIESEKNTLIKTLVSADIVEEATGSTQDEERTDRIPVYLFDPSEFACSNEIPERLRTALAQSDILLWVVGYGRNDFSADAILLALIAEAFPDMPLLIVGHAIDRVSSLFNPAVFSLMHPKTESEKAAHAWLSALKKDLGRFSPQEIVPCAAGGHENDMSRQYNLVCLSSRIESLIPQEKRAAWLCCEKVCKDKSQKSDKMIIAATAAAGAVGLIPFPVADMPFIVTIQVALIMSLSSLYGKVFTRDSAKSYVLAALSALIGPIMFQNIIKALPFLGSMVGGGIAAGCTYAVGKGAKLILEKNEPFEMATFLAYVKTFYKNYRKDKKRIQK